MKKTLGSFLFVSLLAFAIGTSSAQAQWTGAQALTGISGEHAFDSVYGMRGTLSNLRTPSGSMNATLAYAGPTFVLHSDGGLCLWVSPQLAGVFNFFPGHDAAGPSLWISLAKGRWTAFAESEAYFGTDHRRAYYGLYTLDASLMGRINLGVHSQQVDEGLTFGPHAGANIGPAHLEVGYFYGNSMDGDRMQLLRTTLTLFFKD